MVGTPEEHTQALQIVHDGDQHDDRAVEGNDSTQVAAEAITTPATDPPMHLMGSWEAEPHIAAINSYWDTRSWGASSSGSQDLPDSMQVAAEKDYICCSSQ